MLIALSKAVWKTSASDIYALYHGLRLCSFRHTVGSEDKCFVARSPNGLSAVEDSFTAFCTTPFFPYFISAKSLTKNSRTVRMARTFSFPILEPQHEEAYLSSSPNRRGNGTHCRKR